MAVAGKSGGETTLAGRRTGGGLTVPIKKAVWGYHRSYLPRRSSYKSLISKGWN
jgi:hypothetical protein